MRVITRHGQKMVFLVTQITNERIEGSGQGVDMDDIDKIEHREFSVWKTATLIAFIALFMFLAAVGGPGAPVGSGA